MIAPVNLEYLDKMDWWQQQNAMTQETLRKDRNDIAKYMQDRFVQSISKDPNHRLVVSTEAGPDTVVAEFALIELIPSKAFFNAAATAGGFLVPGVGTLSALGKGSVAIEGRIRDSVTGNTLAQMADREGAKTAIVDIASMTWYDSAKDNINDWADQFVKLVNSPMSEKVADSSPVTFITW